MSFNISDNNSKQQVAKLLSDTEKAAIDAFLSKIDITNTAQILQFGASAQNNISKFSDSVLTEVKTKEIRGIKYEFNR